MDIKSMNLWQRMHAITEEIGLITKDGRNDHFKYNYVSEAQYVAKLRPLLTKYRVQITPCSVEYQRHPDNDMSTTVVKFRIVNIDKPDEYEVVMSVGEGSDSRDKGVYKALTGTKKYLIALTFMVETGDDAEDDRNDSKSSKKPAKKITKETDSPSDW